MNDLNWCCNMLSSGKFMPLFLQVYDREMTILKKPTDSSGVFGRGEKVGAELAQICVSQNYYILMNFFASEVVNPIYFSVEFYRKSPAELPIMKFYSKSLMFCALVLAMPIAVAEDAKDCMLQGTVQHGEQAGKGTTMVKIDSISKYDEQSRCEVRRGQKLEFKLPPDGRLKEAPSGSEVKYRYRTDSSGEANSELISIGT